MSLNKRISDIENRIDPKTPPRAWVANIRSNGMGKVELRHPENKMIHLPDVEALNEWEKKKNGLPVIRIEYMRPEPDEY